MNFTFFLYHNSDVNSYLAFLLGYAGTMNMVAPCGWKGNISVGGIVMDLLMTIVIMTVMDMLFAKDTAAHMAQDSFQIARTSSCVSKRSLVCLALHLPWEHWLSKRHAG